MGSWRDHILKEFIPNLSKLTIVADPDALLTEEKLSLSLKNKGFDIIEFNDTIEFRFAYESRYRTLWDQGVQTDLVVVLRLQSSEIEALPYDLLQAGRILSFDLGTLFPDLSYPIIEKLDRAFLDTLYDAQEKYSPGRLGDNATKDFILSHVFGVSAVLINNDVDLLRTLLRIHYNHLNIPDNLNKRLIQILAENTKLSQWSLDDIIPSSEAFFQFLQERWPIFLENLNAPLHVRDGDNTYGLQYQGPTRIPFGHQDILVYIDNLFIEGKLTPIDADKMNINPEVENKNLWIKSGIMNKDEDNSTRIDKFLKLIESIKPSSDSRYTDWIAFSLKLAELTALIHTDSVNQIQKKEFCKLNAVYNKIFAEWLSMFYSTMVSLPPTTPAMLHHVPKNMARTLDQAPSKNVALIVLDGLALDQWMSLKQIFINQMNNISLEESAVFAWIPTLTSVSRQSVFAGKPPFYFSNSINSTNAEPKLWQQFWENHGIQRLDISYKRGLGKGDPIDDLEPLVIPGKTKVLGLVIDTIDKIMHGMQLGANGMHNQIKQWAEQKYLSGLTAKLLDYGYQVWITSDHGNIECKGEGRLSEGAIAEMRGERVRIYPNKDLRSQMQKKCSFAYEWEPIALPNNYFPLIAGERAAFIKKDDIIVGHGGASIEEVIVPLIKIERRRK